MNEGKGPATKETAPTIEPDEVEEASESSFPASDPPSWASPSRLGGPSRTPKTPPATPAAPGTKDDRTC